MSLQAGAAKVIITPPIGTFLSGYSRRTHGAVGVNDQLWARALYLSDGSTEVVLVTLEVLGVPGNIVASIRKRAAELTGIPEDGILISATHTHSGPTLSQGTDNINGRYVAFMEDSIVGVIEWAKQQRVDGASASMHQASVQCGVNRREMRDGQMVLGVNPEGPVYPYADIMHVRGPAGETIAVWFMHPCHAVILGQTNYIISGDYAGAACRFVEANSQGIAMFANGFAGNINAQYHPAGFAEVELVGRRLGAAVSQALTDDPVKPYPQGELRMAARQYSFHLPTDPIPAVEEAELALRKMQESQEPAPSRPIRTRADVRAAFELGGYEVERARAKYHGLRITADAGEVLVRECLQALQSAWQQRP